MNASDPPLLLSLRGLSLYFGDGSSAPTLDDIDLDVERGEIVALVGESGSGKSILAHTIAGILSPAARVSVERHKFGGVDLRPPAGRAWASVRGREIGVVFQNPRAALNPIRAIGDQIADVLKEHRGFSGSSLHKAVIAALAAMRIADPDRRVAAYPSSLSGGMCQRVMLAIALAGDPSLLVADEPTTGLDMATQKVALDLIIDQATRRKMATLLITHDLTLARAYAQRIVVMHAGQIVEEAPAPLFFAKPHHPYSAALIRATPADVERVADLEGVPGGLPDLRGSVPGCRFAPRCARAEARCRVERPPASASAERRMVACWRPV
jgi:peptide/nickel transport system ATP-binding protein